jgi:hypothetical protein
LANPFRAVGLDRRGALAARLAMVAIDYPV